MPTFFKCSPRALDAQIRAALHLSVADREPSPHLWERIEEMVRALPALQQHQHHQPAGKMLNRAV